MNLPSPASRADNGPGYPRYFRIAGRWVNSFKVFLCVGIYLGILVIAAIAHSSGIPPLGVALGSLALAIIGLAGARVYHLLAGILAGGFWVRLGCAFNGCCGGRETRGWCGVCLHDTRGVRRRRVPVQFLEMAWWLLGGIGFIWLWPKSFPPGNYALGVLAWYGLGRFFLEPLREAPDLIAGRVRINQCVAAALVLGAGGALLARAFAS